MANLTLAGLYETFNQQITQTSKITLDKSVLINKNNLDFVATLLGGQLVLVNAKATLDQTASPNKLTVVGTVENTSTVAGGWIIPGVSGASLTDVNVLLVYVERESKAVDMATAFEGAIAIDNQPVLCSGTPVEGGGLKFGLKGDQKIQAPLAAVADFVTGSRMTSDFLPTSVKIFADVVPITSIDLTFGLSYAAPTRTPTPTQLRLSSEVGGPWNFLDGVNLSPLKKVGLRLFSTYTPHPFGRPMATYGADIHADFKLAGHCLEARLAFTRSDAWEISLLPASEHGTLPGLVDVADALGAKAEVETALSALGLGDISVLGVSLGFNLKDRKFLYFSLVGRVRIIDVNFDLWIRLPDFQFGGGLARGSNISFRAIVDHFFSAPDNFPGGSVEEFAIAAQPSAGTYSLTVALTTDDFALGPVKLEGLELVVEKTRQGFDGSMTATMDIAKNNFQVIVRHPRRATAGSSKAAPPNPAAYRLASW
jgi:hypothetical protein